MLVRVQHCYMLSAISKVIRQNIGVSFPEAVRDNVVSNDVTITSSLRSDMIIFGINFQYS